MHVAASDVRYLPGMRRRATVSSVTVTNRWPRAICGTCLRRATVSCATGASVTGSDRYQQRDRYRPPPTYTLNLKPETKLACIEEVQCSLRASRPCVSVITVTNRYHELQYYTGSRASLTLTVTNRRGPLLFSPALQMRWRLHPLSPTVNDRYSLSPAS